MVEVSSQTENSLAKLTWQAVHKVPIRGASPFERIALPQLHNRLHQHFGQHTQQQQLLVPDILPTATILFNANAFWYVLLTGQFRTETCHVPQSR